MRLERKQMKRPAALVTSALSALVSATAMTVFTEKRVRLKIRQRSNRGGRAPLLPESLTRYYRKARPTSLAGSIWRAGQLC